MYAIVRPRPVLVLTFVFITLVVAACDGHHSDSQAVAPVAVGLIANTPNGLRNIQGFKDGMEALGYVDGESIRYLFAGSLVEQADLENAIREMVEAEVHLIFTAGTPTGVAAHRVTAGIDVPVVFGVIADPIAAGVMTYLTKPGGNMTGVMLSQNQARRLEFLLEIAPGTRRVFVPFDPGDTAPRSAVIQIERVANTLGVELIKGEAHDDRGVTELLRRLPDDIDVIFLVPDSTVNRRLSDILAIAIERKLPVSGPSTAQVEEGALTTYGFVHHEVGVQAARMADQIFNGVDPAELPVETAEFYLSINLATAGAIGLKIPDNILRQASIIIH